MTAYKLDYRIWLQEELLARFKKNPAFSLRAFARNLELDPSTVSQLISGKRKPSQRMLHYLCDKLAAPPHKRQLLMTSLSRKDTTENSVSKHEYIQLSEDVFSVIADWYHFAILELTYVKGFKTSPKWIAKSLGLRLIEAKSGIERLTRLGLLKQENGRWYKTNKTITNKSGANNAPALKVLQRAILTKALEAIDIVPAEEKDITSMTMAIDTRKLPEARNKIMQFRRELCAFLESGTADRVYNLGLQLYPISKDSK